MPEIFLALLSLVMTKKVKVRYKEGSNLLSKNITLNLWWRSFKSITLSKCYWTFRNILINYRLEQQDDDLAHFKQPSIKPADPSSYDQSEHRISVPPTSCGGGDQSGAEISLPISTTSSSAVPRTTTSTCEGNLKTTEGILKAARLGKTATVINEETWIKSVS